MSIVSKGGGTVSLSLARWSGVSPYYIEEAHESLPNHRTVQRAVIDILQHGTTSPLDTEYYPVSKHRSSVIQRESLLRAALLTSEHRSLSKEEMRNILNDFVSP